MSYDMVPVTDLTPIWGETSEPLLLVNIRGTNGSGKSTIPMSMMDDEDMFFLSWCYTGREKPFATVFPKYGCVALGTYMNKTGGLDTFKNNDMTRKALEILWACPYNIIMEGVISSTIKSTYNTLFKEMTECFPFVDRLVVVASLLPDINVCLERVQKRNGGKPVNNSLIEGKWKIVDRNVDYFKDEGFISLRLDNSHVTVEETLGWFNKIVQKASSRGLCRVQN